MNRMTTTVCGLALIVLLCGAASAATTIYVPGDYATIQAAVNNAAAGDTIYVYNGTYTENVDIGTPQLTLEGEGAGVVTVTAAVTNDHVFNVTADYVNITGFTMTGATAAPDWHAGVYLRDADRCNISDNIASGNCHGIWLYYSSDNTLTENICSGNDEYGVYLRGSSDNTLMENDCLDNDKLGIHLRSSSDNTLAENNCADSCRGIYLWSSSTNNTLTGNNCPGNDYSGIEMWGSSDNNTLTGNNCMGNGNGIYLWDSSTSNTLTGNECSDNNNGIWLRDSCDNNVSCNWVHNNTYAGFYLSSGSTGNIIERNNIIANGNYNDTSDGYEWQFRIYQSDDVNTAGNWWGTNNETRINASIYDWTYDAGQGNVTIEPADGVVPCAPIPELPTVLLFAVGLLMIAGYVQVGRRKT